MQVELIVEHTIAKLLPISNFVLDIGCRHFDFSKEMARKGFFVISIEPDTSVLPVEDKQIILIHAAIVPRKQNLKNQTLIKFGNGTANHLCSITGSIPTTHEKQNVTGLSINEIMARQNINFWEIVKLDCEGAEYNVLLDWPGPIARQITVEFHEHTGANSIGEKIYNEIFERLSQWYTCVQHKKEIKHCLNSPNYWDTLFVLKDEILHKIKNT